MPETSFVERVKSFFSAPLANGYSLIPSYGATDGGNGLQVLPADATKIEPKVWLAAERTLLNWLRVALLVSSFALALFNSAAKGDNVTKGMGVVYAVLAVLILGYAWRMQNIRRTRIITRYGGHHDDLFGPVVICFLIFAAVLVNFILRTQQREALRHTKSPKNPWMTTLDLVQEAFVVPESIKSMF